MRIDQRYRHVIINVLIAIAIGIVLNFAYFIFLMTPPPADPAVVKKIPPLPASYHIFQLGYCSILSFICLTVNTMKFNGRNGTIVFAKRVAYSTIITVTAYFFSPKIVHGGEIGFLFESRHMIDPKAMLNCSFILVVSLLYGKIYDLLYKQQRILFENEQLRSNNLQATYTNLINQINPHFFFNSLNSLSMLVREKNTDKALNYIQQLSETFRYILRTEDSMWITLGRELEYLDAVKYLLEVRYEGKIGFNIKVEPQCMDKLLPVHTLQLLVENAVKHNAILRSEPLTLDITTLQWEPNGLQRHRAQTGEGTRDGDRALQSFRAA